MRKGLDYQGNDRFLVIRRLGAGGMGVVYEVHDRQRQTRVALKTIPEAEPELLYRLKSEFRILTGITHPNLVTLYELLASGDQWFFTMELVEGCNFVQYVREDSLQQPDSPELTVSMDTIPSVQAYSPAGAQVGAANIRIGAPQCNIDRLRSTLVQLITGVRFLHGAGKLHRDLKPSNVMVTHAGRVIILDFGLSVDLRPNDFEGAMTHTASGTPRYMAPEQIQSAALTDASDWYAAGLMMFEALTGRWPFQGNPAEILQWRLTADGGKPSDFCDGIPADLDLLCRDLLKLRPEERPGGEEILDRLGARGHATVPPSPASSSAFIVGREGPLAVMRDAFNHTAEHGPAIVSIAGKSGMGKSVLLEMFLDERAADPQTVILSGRCYEQESVPFKALDALIDSLGRYLRRLPPGEAAELLPRHVGVLAQMFPTLLRVPAIANAPRGRPADRDAIESRQVASAAFRELIGRITDRKRLVVAIDDLHWGDFDSAVLLSQLLDPPDPPPVLLIATTRKEEEESNAGLAPLQKENPACRRFEIALERLRAADVMEMYSRLGGGQKSLSAEDAERIARDSQGNPFFIREVLSEELAMSGSTNVDDLLWLRATQLEEDSRRLLEIVSISGRPLQLRLASQAAQLEDNSLPVYTALRNARLLRRAGTTEPEQVETYHDRIRETIGSRLNPETRRTRHGQLAQALLSTPAADPEHLAFHLEGAGEAERAGDLYAVAGQRAAAAFAFDQAASLYDRALRLSAAKGEARRNLVTQLAEALANSGRSYQAAGRFEEAARDASGAALVDLKQRAAYYYCISGRIDEGKDQFRDVLGQFGIGMPASAGKAVAALLKARFALWLRGLKFVERAPETLPPMIRERLDTVWSAAVGLGNADVITGLNFSTRGVILSLDAGDPARIVRSLCWESCLSAIDNVNRARRLIDRAEEVIKRCDGPYLRGLLYLAKAIHLINLTSWRDSIEFFDKAVESWREQRTGVDWELGTARNFCFWALIHSGEFLECGKRVRQYIREAEERGNLYQVVNAGCFSAPLVLLAEDQPAAAERICADSMARWTRKYYLVQHLLSELSDIERLLYTGQTGEARKALKVNAQRSHQHNFDRLAINRTYSGGLALHECVLTAAQSDHPDLKSAESAAHTLDKETLPWAKAMVLGGRAAISWMRHDRPSTISLLEQCIAKYDGMGMSACSFTAKRRLGDIVGGDRGRELVRESEGWLRSHGVANLDRFANRTLPMRSAGDTIA